MLSNKQCILFNHYYRYFNRIYNVIAAVFVRLAINTRLSYAFYLTKTQIKDENRCV